MVSSFTFKTWIHLDFILPFSVKYVPASFPFPEVILCLGTCGGWREDFDREAGKPTVRR